jgi:hypothetical protein
MINRRRFFSLAAPAIVLSTSLMPGHSLEKLFWTPSTYIRRYILPDGTYAYVKTFEQPYLKNVDIQANGFVLKDEYGTLITRCEYERHYNAIAKLDSACYWGDDTHKPDHIYPKLTSAAWHHSTGKVTNA